MNTKEITFSDERLQAFIEKILEKNISEKEIKKEMQTLGLNYTKDPLQRLNTLLKKLHPNEEFNTIQETNL